MNDFKTRIETLKINQRKAEQEKTKLETQHEAAVTNRDKTVEEMQALGVTPETIQQELAKLEVQIEADLQKAEQLMPRL